MLRKLRFEGRDARISSAQGLLLLLGSTAVWASVILSRAALLSLLLSRIPRALVSRRAGVLVKPPLEDAVGCAVRGSDV